MADIVEGLFGVSPERLKAQQDAQFQAQQFSLAQLNPEQQRFIQLGAGGRALGQAVGGMFGAQDPAMYEQKQTYDLIQQTLSGLTPEQQQNPITVHTALYNAAQKVGNANLANKSYTYIQEANAIQGNQSIKLAQASKINAEVASNVKLREELSKLPKDATDEQKLNVYYHFASPEVSLKALENKASLSAGRDDKLKIAEDNRSLAREKIQADYIRVMDVAKQQGATQTAVNAMANGMKMQLAQYDRDTKLAVETTKASNKAIKVGHPKDVAEAASNIIGAQILNEDTIKFIKQIDNNDVKFGIGINIAGKTSTVLGMATENALKQNNIKRHLDGGVNALLLQAKGTQTEGDAQRAQDLYLKAIASNDKQSWKDALITFTKSTNKLIAEKKVYMSERGFPYKEAASDGWSIVEKN